MGVITTKKSLVQLEKLSTASFCRRRLAVVLVRLKMSETMKEACTFVEQASCYYPHRPLVRAPRVCMICWSLQNSLATALTSQMCSSFVCFIAGAHQGGS